MKHSASITGIALIAVMSLAAGLCTLGPAPLPDLLVGASADNGPVTRGCPVVATAADAMPTLGGGGPTSTDIDHRLQIAFPPGTPQDALQRYLKARGFHINAPCTGDPSIQSADYFRPAISFGYLSVRAQVYWQRDPAGRIVRTWGRVAYEPTYL